MRNFAIVAYGLCTKRNSRQANFILFLDAIKAWYLLSTLARCRGATPRWRCCGRLSQSTWVAHTLWAPYCDPLGRTSSWSGKDLARMSSTGAADQVHLVKHVCERCHACGDSIVAESCWYLFAVVWLKVEASEEGAAATDGASTHTSFINDTFLRNLLCLLEHKSVWVVR